jgi:protein arginine N-methyltransferase 1
VLQLYDSRNMGWIPMATSNSVPALKVESNRRVELESNVLGQFIPLHYHFQMLQDRQRLAAFRGAMELHLQPGMHVVELGGGTGILSSFAARLGTTVTCVERNPQLAAFAQNAIRENGLSNQIEVVLQDASKYIPDKPVDAVICEMLHVGLLREKQTEVITAFKQNYQNHWNEPLPRFFPEASRLMLQLIDHPFEFDGYYAPLPIFQNPDLYANDGLHELSPLIDYEHLFYDELFSDSIRWSGIINAQSNGFLSAIRFVTQNFLSVEANGESPVWSNQFLIVPLQDPSPITLGQNLKVEFEYRYGDPLERLQHSIQVTYLPVNA